MLMIMMCQMALKSIMYCKNEKSCKKESLVQNSCWYVPLIWGVTQLSYRMDYMYTSVQEGSTKTYRVTWGRLSQKNEKMLLFPYKMCYEQTVNVKIFCIHC